MPPPLYQPHCYRLDRADCTIWTSSKEDRQTCSSHDPGHCRTKHKNITSDIVRRFKLSTLEHASEWIV